MNECSSSASVSGTMESSCTSTGTPTQLSVHLVKAFVQPDGSHGNGAGVVLLPRISRMATKQGTCASRGHESSEHRFPSDNDCLKIAKRVGLAETSFVLFPGEEDGDGSKESADFHVKWYTPECEVDLCGHATVALAGYIYSTIEERASAGIGTGLQQDKCFWRMQCKSGLLGIEVVDGVGKNPFPRVVMEQATPQFCEIVDCNEIAESLCIQVKDDFAISNTANDNSEEPNTSNGESIEQLFPFPHCEIVSTGGRDLMIPIRSSVLNEMDILGSGSGTDCKIQQQLCHYINVVSKRHKIVGYHMFEVDDQLFQSKNNSESAEEIFEGQNTNEEDRSIHLNELIRIFQEEIEKGRSGVDSCLEAVWIEKERCCYDNEEANMRKRQYQDDRRNETTNTIPTVRKLRTILVTGVRNFAPFVGIPEEPATGSANGALACYLVKHLFLNSRGRVTGHSLENPVCFRFCMEQGRAMGEPCLIDAEIEVVNDTIRTVKVGGHVNVTGDSLELDLDLTSIY